MLHTRTWGLAAVLSVVLAACGGGSDEPVSPPTTGNPTATLAASAQSASDSVAAARSGASALNKVNGIGNLLPVGVQSAPLGVTGSDTSGCSGGGSYVETYTVASESRITRGDKDHLVFSSCVEMGITFSGTLDIEVKSYSNDSNFAVTFGASGFTAAQGGVTTGPYSFDGEISLVNGVAGLSFSVDGQTVVGAPSVTRNGSSVVVNAGTTRDKQGDGFVEVRFTGWRFDANTLRPTAGTAVVTGAGGNKATITVAADGYHVSFNIGGTISDYVVPF